jgi:uncharacterized protein YacL
MAIPRSVGWLGLVVGIVLLLVAVFAAQLGLGGTTYGLKHIVVLVVGIVLAVAGLYIALRPASSSSRV